MKVHRNKQSPLARILQVRLRQSKQAKSFLRIKATEGMIRQSPTKELIPNPLVHRSPSNAMTKASNKGDLEEVQKENT